MPKYISLIHFWPTFRPLEPIGSDRLAAEALTGRLKSLLTYTKLLLYISVSVNRQKITEEMQQLPTTIIANDYRIVNQVSY